MKADPEFEPLLKKWGSEKAVYAFLKKGFDRINRAAFGGSLEMPELQIRPMEQNATGNYAPAERYRPAVIGIFMNVLMDEDPARRVLAHYVVQILWQLIGRAKIILLTWTKKSRKNSQLDIVSVLGETLIRTDLFRRPCDVAKSLSIPARGVLFES